MSLKDIYLTGFQSTLPYGSDDPVNMPFVLPLQISIHAPLRERHIKRGLTSPTSLFQSTLPYGSDDNSNNQNIHINNFNPRSLTGATTSVILYTTVGDISIHAPLRERLKLYAMLKMACYISIHAPLRERRGTYLLKLSNFLFQSTLPYGSDDPVNMPFVLPLQISIHAPLRERHIKRGLTSPTSLFQSTLPYGSDDNSNNQNIHINNFNPRSLTGATTSVILYTTVGDISIHAPLRERLKLYAMLKMACYISIHAPLRERRGTYLLKLSNFLFQSTLPYGSDLIVLDIIYDTDISIHAPLRERPHQNKLLLYSFKSSIFCEPAQLKYSRILF